MIRIAEWKERKDKGLRIESGVNDGVLESMNEFLEEVWKKRED